MALVFYLEILTGESHPKNTLFPPIRYNSDKSTGTACTNRTVFVIEQQPFVNHTIQATQ
jgi:hypothetical protein